MSSLIQSSARPAQAVMRATGPDALSFLQGQFTQDLKGLGTGRVAYGLWLNQKGKVMGDSWILGVAEESFLVVAESMTATALRERLEAYLIADDVVLEDEAGRWLLVRIEGVDTVDWLRSTGGAMAGPGEIMDLGGGYAWMDARGEWVWLRPAAASLAVPGRVLGEDEAIWARVERGGVAIPGEVQETDLPNEAGLEDPAISYTKGCYLGQEVMARLKAMGQVRRRLMRVRGRGTLPPKGAELVSQGKRIGEFRGGAARGEDYVGYAMVLLLHYHRDSTVECLGQPLVVEELFHE